MVTIVPKRSQKPQVVHPLSFMPRGSRRYQGSSQLTSLKTEGEPEGRSETGPEGDPMGAMNAIPTPRNISALERGGSTLEEDQGDTDHVHRVWERLALR